MAPCGLEVRRRFIHQFPHVGAKWIACLHDAILRKPTVQSWESCANPVHPLGQQSVGDARKAVLLLDEGGDAFAHGLVQQGPARKTSDANHHLRLLNTQDAPRCPKAVEQFEREAEVLGAGPTAVQSTDPQPIDAVPCRRDFVHLHPSQGTHKVHFCLGISPFDFIGDGQCGVDVSACASS